MNADNKQPRPPSYKELADMQMIATGRKPSPSSDELTRLRSVCEELASALTGAKEYMYITSCPRDVFDKAQQALARYKDLV
jgi:hypothetical protein